MPVAPNSATSIILFRMIRLSEPSSPHPCPQGILPVYPGLIVFKDHAFVETRTGWMDKINETLRPYILDRKELDSEMHISETPRDLWRVQGIDPPPTDSEAEKSWKAKNYAHPY
ncbi:hypothetical protein AALT_g6420 [Alternaria alternata]|nr:hypothetical protein AALT_g6420 [Alternaria alternata]